MTYEGNICVCVFIYYVAFCYSHQKWKTVKNRELNVLQKRSSLKTRKIEKRRLVENRSFSSRIEDKLVFQSVCNGACTQGEAGYNIWVHRHLVLRGARNIIRERVQSPE